MPFVTVYLYDYGADGPRFYGFGPSAGRLVSVGRSGIRFRDADIVDEYEVSVPEGAAVAGYYLIVPGLGTFSAEDVRGMAERGEKGFGLRAGRQ